MTGTRTPQLAQVDLPDFGRPIHTPELPASLYEERLERLRARMAERGYDRLVLYADREHSANVAWLTGFDPRFEEAIVIVGADGDPAVLVGNECVGMARSAPQPMRVILHQDLSLPSQPRHRSRPLRDELGDEGIVDGRRIGMVGWKSFAERSTLDAPSFLVDAVRELVGGAGSVDNATDLLIDPADGLRVHNEVDQLAADGGRRGHDVDRRPAPDHRTSTRAARARRRGAPRLGRLAAVVPPDADGG